LAEVVVDIVIKQGGEEVADEGGEEEEGDDGIADVVVGFDLGHVSLDNGGLSLPLWGDLHRGLVLLLRRHSCRGG
jgi:hypothetical protein